METCAVKQSQPQQICACIYDEIVHRISFDRYVELDKQMQKDPGFVPDELIPIGADCASRPTNSNSPSSGP